MPNEDAQSFVFDTTNLFDRDKFSGYDRIEGGTRANLGVRYTGAVGDDIALYDNGFEVWVWVGKGASASERARPLATGAVVTEVVQARCSAALAQRSRAVAAARRER